MPVLTHLFRRAVLALLLLSAGGLAHAQPGAAIDEGLALHLLNRLGYGPAPGEVARVRTLGVQAYVDSQLAPPPLPPRLRALSEAGTPGEERLLRAIAGPRQLEEVLLGFWLAHLREDEAAGPVLRPHVLGRYAGLRTALEGQAREQGGTLSGDTERSAMQALVRHFVSAPSAGLQRSVARVWEDTGGEQRAVLRLLLASPEFLAPSQWNTKRKDGFRFVVSAVRASGVAVENVAPLMPFVRATLSDEERSGFVERLASGRLALAVAPVRPQQYASSAPPLRAGAAEEAGQGMLAQPGPPLMAAPTPSAAAMAAAARSQPAEPGRLRERLRQPAFLRY